MRQILPFVNNNGHIVAIKSTGRRSIVPPTGIPILNEGFQYGKGIFTTIKIRQGQPLFLDRHIHRLKTSAKQLNIPLPSYVINHTSYIYKAAHATIKQNKLINGGIRITLTPGIICIHAFTTNADIRKISVITAPDTRDIYKTHKLTYRIPHLLAQKKAQSENAQDALFTLNNYLIESTCANIFSYSSDKTIVTPQIKEYGLNGITRQILMENLPVQEAPIPITTTNPLILVNSLNLRIVESIDGKKINQNPEFANLFRQTLDKAEKNYISGNSFYF